jgi:Phage tail tube protein, GTA-gp10
MSNTVRGKIDFEVGGSSYSLHFTANGMCELEDAAGCSAMAFLKRLEASAADDLSFGDVRLLFWAGLQEHHPELTVRDAGALMTSVGGIGGAMELAGRAVAESMPKPDDGGDTSQGKKTKGAS